MNNIENMKSFIKNMDIETREEVLSLISYVDEDIQDKWYTAFSLL